LLHQNKESIGKRVVAFFNTVKHCISLTSYIIDFVVFDDHIKIVELNPFSRTTGPCLFDWVTDAVVIENGPFEFRVNTEPLPTVHGHLLPWKGQIEQAMTEIAREDNDSCCLQ